MLAKISISPYPSGSATDPEEEKTYLVVRRWTEYHPHIQDDIENIELLEEDGTILRLYNIFNDDDWSDVWCSPDGFHNYAISFK